MDDNKLDVFGQDIEIPEIVQKKADAVFSRIREERTDEMKRNSRQRKYGRGFTRPVAAAVGICLVAAVGITSIGAGYHYWSRGMQGTIQATPQQQTNLVEEGIAVVAEEQADLQNMAVTNQGVTVTPEDVIVDRHFAHICFSIEGFDLKEQEDPMFEIIEAYLGEEDDILTGVGKFYDGTIFDSEGNWIYDNGDALEHDENDRVIMHYESEEEKIEYIVTLFSYDLDKVLLGGTVHVTLQNLGTDYSAIFETAVDGKWEFDIPLKGKDSSKYYTVNAYLEDTNAFLTNVELSPISLRMNMDFQGESGTMTYKDEDGNIREKNVLSCPPLFYGVRLEDGTLFPLTRYAGYDYYTDDELEHYGWMLTFTQVIDVERVDALLFLKNEEQEGEIVSEEDLYIVPLR